MGAEYLQHTPGDNSSAWGYQRNDVSVHINLNRSTKKNFKRVLKDLKGVEDENINMDLQSSFLKLYKPLNQNNKICFLAQSY